MINYWPSSPDQICKEDVAELRRLRQEIENSPVEEGTVGGRLRRVNMLMEIGRVLGQLNELAGQYQRYLSILVEEKFYYLALFGGRGAVETSMLWGRPNEANALLKRWLDVAKSTMDPNLVKRFAKEELSRGQLWTTVNLLDRFLAKPSKSKYDQFEMGAMKCLALAKLRSLLAARAQLKDPALKAQAEWVASSVSASRLEVLLAESLAEARRRLKALPGVTAEQKALISQIEAIPTPFNSQ